MSRWDSQRRVNGNVAGCCGTLVVLSGEVVEARGASILET